jgi:biofilm PGA synthesis N-glycosyltransferase PgaC
MIQDKINTCEVGIMAFNEEANIEFLIEDLLRQRMSKFSITGIIIVTSGCTDSTQEIVKHMQKKHDVIRLLIQEQRHGKASAINLFLSQAKGDFVVLIAADTRIEEHALERILIPLFEKEVGMTGGRPMPVNRTDNFLGYGAHFLWQLHHQLSLHKPKLGEFIAFRNYIREIPMQAATDEALLEALFFHQGLSLKYVPEALVYNRGPETIKEFLSQRERIFIGHLWVKKNYHYSVSSLDNWLIAKLAIKNISFKPKHCIWTIGLILLEILARLKGAFKFFIFKSNPYIWDRITTTKSLVTN